MQIYICYFLLLVNSNYITASCTSPWLRKEIRELSDVEFNRYVKAVKSLHKGIDPDRYTIWEKMSRQHRNAARKDKEIHNTPAFLPWHRRFIRDYEEELQKYDSRVTLPYWDWTLDADRPHRSSVLTEMYLGGNGNSNKNFILDSGAFKNTELSFPDRHFVSRQYNRGNSISPFASVDELKATLNNRRYSDFCFELEEMHNDIHINLGGDFDMGRHISPNDPIFYLHHAFLDLLWDKWSHNNKGAKYEGLAYSGKSRASKDDDLYDYNGGVSSALEIGTGQSNSRYCYKYPEYPRNIVQTRTDGRDSRSFKLNQTDPTSQTPVQKAIIDLSLDQAIAKLKSLQLTVKANNSTYQGRTSKYLFRPPRPDFVPKPEAWILENKLDLQKIREHENKRIQFRKLLDSLPINLDTV